MKIKYTKNKRNLEYEKKFKTYLFKFDFETHKAICKNINVVESTEETRKIKKKELNKKRF